MNYFSKVLLVISLGLGALMGNAAEQVNISPENAVILVSNKATETERFAAEELQKYISKITNIKIPVKTDFSQTDKFKIIVGVNSESKKYLNDFDKRLSSSGSDSFIIDANAKRMILIGGGDRGTLYSVYELLEQQGCRWFFPGKLGEVIPKNKNIRSQPGKKQYNPDFVQRSLGMGQVDGIGFEDMIDWAAKNRLNRMFGLRFYFIRKYLPRNKWNAWTKRGGMQKWQWICHNLNFMVPSSKYYKNHPEYYALYKGKRERMGSSSRPGYGGGNLCTTNKDVIKLCAEFAIDWFDKNKDGVVVPLWPGDGAIKWCECKNCRKLKGINFMSGRRGSMSRRMVTFANAVARIVAKKYPDRYILCPAYSNYVMPTKIPLEKNVLVQYCLHGDYAHGMDKSKFNAKEKKWLDVWAKQAGGRMGIWDYFLLGDHRSANKENKAMLPVSYRAKDCLKYFKDKGVNWYFTQTSPKYWKHNILPFYVTARYIWNADQNFSEFLNDFCNKMYGKAGPYLKKYYTAIEDSVAASDWHPQIYSDVAVPSPKVFTPKLISACEGYLQFAEASQTTNIEKQRIALARATFNHIKSNIGVQSSLGIDPNAEWGIKRGENYYIMNPEGKAISKHDLDTLKLNALDSGTYNDQFKKIMFRAPKRKMPLVSIENNVIKIVVMPEVGGRLLRIIDKKTGRNFLKEAVGSGKAKSISTSYFNYGGYEEYFGKAFASSGWEIPFKCKKTSGKLVMSAELDGLKIRRTISIPAGNSRTISIKTVLKNASAIAQKCTVRVHPIVTMGIPCDDTSIVVSMKNGDVKDVSVCQANDQFINDSSGFWAFADKKQNIGIANIFNPKKASAYVCKTGKDYFNFELIGKEQSLAPGKEYTFEHKYIIFTNFKKQIKPFLNK